MTATAAAVLEPEGHGARPGRPLPHLPALDGLRGVAVAGVVAFHAGAGWANGGYLGVSTFFTLSGFLITNLLVREWDATGAVRTGRFWERRFRRLLPAALVALALTTLGTWWLGSAEQVRALRYDALASLSYVANWRLVVAGSDYAALSGLPSAFQHFWSLAIEEQFYVLFPLLALVLLHRGGRRALTLGCGLLVVGSVALGVVLSGDPNRVYLGTDTRAAELLAGCLLALWWSRRSDAVGDVRPRWTGQGRWVDAAALGVVGVGLWAWTAVGEDSPWWGRGGFLVHAAGTCLVILAATRRGWVTALLSLSWLRWLGRVSYGVYLYHWPLFVLVDEDATGLDGPALLGLRLGVTLVVAAASYRFLEQPVRRRMVLADPRRALAAAVGGAAVVAALAVVTTLRPPAATVPFAGASLDDFAPQVTEVGPDRERPGAGAPTPTAPPESGPAAPPEAPSTPTMPTFPVVPAPETVVVVGDSGTVDLSPALSAALVSAGTRRVVSVAAPGFGLTVRNADIDRRWGDVVRRERPDLVVVMFGGWDTPFLRDRGEDAYAEEVDRAVAVLTSTGARVLWLSMLPGGATPDRAPDRVTSRLPERFPGTVVWWDVEAALRGPDGDHLTSAVEHGRRVLLRKPDGWHLCPEGAARVAASAMAGGVVGGLTPPPGAGWESGRWRRDDVYDDPPGGCDA